MAQRNKSLAEMNKSPDVGKATKGCLALPVTQSEGPNTDVTRSANLPRPVKWLGPFPVHGSDEQIFGLDKQVFGRGQSD